MDINSQEAKRMLAYHRENEKLKEEKQELLEAAKEVREEIWATDKVLTNQTFNKLEKAIKKAEGDNDAAK